MNLFVPVMLFGWIPLTILAFLILRPHHAVLFSVIGGWLFLPMASYDLPGLPEYSKNTAISIGLILGIFLSGHRRKASFQWKIYDLPIILWCSFCPITTALSNQLGLYEGASGVLELTVIYGVPYLAGRIYFNNTRELKDLCLGIIIGGTIYFPLCLWEIRMSPQLHKTIYGYFAHSWGWVQHIRYGGFRPIVFMQHGLMVSLWMALSTTITFWYWRSSDVKHLKGMPMSFIVVALTVTTVLCKSANAWALLTLGFSSYMLYRIFNNSRPFIFLLLLVPLYFILRAPGFISAQDIVSVASTFFDEERILSLADRLVQEDIICVEVLKRPFFGWGGYGRGIPIDFYTGTTLVSVRDSLWLISFNKFGFAGLFSLYIGLLLGPWLILNNNKCLSKYNSIFFQTLAVALSLIVIFFCIDSLFNGMVSPLYITISGALISLYFAMCKNE